MKILKLPAYFDPEQVASSHLTNDVNTAFIRNGYVIENFVPMPCRGVSKEIRNQYKNKRYEEMFGGKIIVHRFSMFPETKSTLLRALRYVLVNIRQYRYGGRAEGVDVIYAGSTPPTQGVLCSKVKKKLSRRYGKIVPFVYVLQDIFPDSMVNAKMTKKDSFIWRIGRKIEDYTYRNADRIIVISEEHKENIMNKGVPEEKIAVIPNWVDTENVVPVSRENNVLIERYRIDPKKFIVCYSGNVGHSQNLTLLIDLAQRIKKEYPDILFVIIGEGAQKEELTQQCQEKDLSNVVILPFQDYSEIAHVFSLGDVGLLISKPGVGNSSIPSKTWGIMSAGRPVLASFDKNSFASRLIDKVGCGLTTEAGDIDALEASLLRLYRDRSAVKTMGEIGRRYVCEVLNKEIATKKYVEVLNDVLMKSDSVQ